MATTTSSGGLSYAEDEQEARPEAVGNCNNISNGVYILSLCLQLRLQINLNRTHTPESRMQKNGASLSG